MKEINDLLQIKILEAQKNLSQETVDAVNSVNWKLTLLRMENSFSPTQLDSLEIETELLLCGILNTEDYLKELENRMKISKAEVLSLVNKMDELIFKKIQEKLIENIAKNTKIPEQVDELAVFKRNFGKSGLFGSAINSALIKKNNTKIGSSASTKQDLFIYSENLKNDMGKILEEESAVVRKILELESEKNELTKSTNDINTEKNKYKIAEIEENIIKLKETDSVLKAKYTSKMIEYQGIKEL